MDATNPREERKCVVEDDAQRYRLEWDARIWKKEINGRLNKWRNDMGVKEDSGVV